MAKNKRFKRTYTILVEGTTTNNSAEKLIDSVLFSVVTALDQQFKQVTVRTINDQES